MNSKYSAFLTVLLVIIIIAIVGIIGFLGYKFIASENSKKEAEDFADSWSENISQNTKKEETTDTKIDDNPITDPIETPTTDSTSNGTNTSSGEGMKYNGFLTAGKIEIPTTGLKSPIISYSEYSKSSLETAVCVVYSTTGEQNTQGSGLNKPGNTVIAGHNYRNSRFFSNNKKLNIGDKIYVTDLDGKRMIYTIYDKFETDDTDTEYMTRDTQGAVEISLTTCTDDSKARLIILAKADA